MMITEIAVPAEILPVIIATAICSGLIWLLLRAREEDGPKRVHNIKKVPKALRDVLDE